MNKIIGTGPAKSIERNGTEQVRAHHKISKTGKIMTREMHPLTRLAFFLGVGFLAATSPTLAQAGLLIIPSQDTLSIPIEKSTGSLVQLPSAVKTITASKHFEIADVASDMDTGTGAKLDVRLFVVKALPGAKSEKVTFVLGNGKAVSVRFVPAEDAENHYDLVFAGEPKKRREARFLRAEVDLMKAMIRDEAGDVARQVTDERVKLEGLDGVRATLTRVFASQGLVGYAFELRNRSGAPISVDVSALSLGAPSRAVLLHVDNPTLDSCGFVSSPTCKTRLLIVARGDVQESRALSVRTASEMPFVRSPQANIAFPEDSQ
jgi:hypothetical protein